MSSLLAGWDKNTVVLFLSDAGAAHEGMNSSRVQVTMELLNRLEGKVEHVLWFNPLPRKFWKGSAAAFFQRRRAYDGMYRGGYRGGGGADQVRKCRCVSVGLQGGSLRRCSEFGVRYSPACGTQCSPQQFDNMTI
ncbi:MAG: hypothetical protein H6556_23075 [Lewinellaceae bacterium]|nr:hypothetical protein [Lewinellaceae bacterium]